MWNVEKNNMYIVWTEGMVERRVSQYRGRIQDTLYFTDFSIKVTDIVALRRG